MPTNVLKVLGQSAPAAKTLTTVYTVPANTEAKVYGVLVCNRHRDPTTFRIAISPGGASDTNAHYQAFDTVVPGNKTIPAPFGDSGITLAPTDEVRVYAYDANLSFSVHGLEVVDDLVTKVVGRMGKTGDQSISAATPTKITWNSSVIAIPASITDIANERFTVPTAGEYQIGVHIQFSTVGAETRITYKINGAAEKWLSRTQLSTNSASVQGTDIVSVAALDDIDFFVYTANASIVRGTVPSYAWIHKVR